MELPVSSQHSGHLIEKADLYQKMERSQEVQPWEREHKA